MNIIKIWISKKPVKISILIAIGFLAGYLFKVILHEPSSVESENQGHSMQSVSQKWTCSMHPQIMRDKPGKCPICAMDLIPLKMSMDEVSREISFSKAAEKLMEIETYIVKHKPVTAEIKMTGKIDYDETRIKNITAWVPGRIDRLYVDFTGITVNKGDHMVYLYSPQLISAQAELLAALKSVKNINSGSSELAQSTTNDLLSATREKLKLFGLTDKQIADIETSDKAVPHITIYSPISGVVIHKNATEGMYVDTGTPIYTVADLSHLWVKLDAYESDLLWIRYGQEVDFTTNAYPGKIFKGKISFIAPVLDDKTRTVKVRVNVDNSESKLKPEMFVKAVIHSKIAIGGKVMTPELAGKWICPMHPDVIEAQKGSCNICGMALVTTESLGYVKTEASEQMPLVIPATAPLITGARAVVYVQLPDTNEPTYQGREIMLGSRAGDYYIVKSGLSEGEVVVTNGNFKIDSAMQIQAKPSMMNPKGSAMPAGHNH